MERLLCCLLGFPEKDAQVLRSLTRLFRPSLSADWAFEVGVTEDCDLLICDLDDAGGRHSWNSPAPPGLLRAAASANDVDAGALLLRKPLRGHGAAGIVQVLNAAASIKRPDLAGAASQPAVPTPAKAPVAEPPPEPSIFFKPEPAPRPAPQPVAEAARNAAPRQLEPVDGELSTLVAADRSTGEAGHPDAPGALAAADPLAIALPGDEPPPPKWAAETESSLEPAQDEADIKDILRRMRFATLGTVSEARTMLDALRAVRASDKASVLEGAGMKSVCVMPHARAWFSAGSPPDLFAWLGDGNRPVRVLPFTDTEEARDAAGCKDEAARPFEQLMWLACIRTPPTDIAGYESALFRLKRWPDLGNLPHEPHHMHWCGILTRQQAPLHGLAGSGGVPPAQTAAFLEACGALGILERKNATPEEIAAVQLPVVSKKGRERISLFKNILGRLRIFKS